MAAERVTQDQEAQVRQAAIEAIVTVAVHDRRNLESDPQTLAWLQERVTQDQEAQVRQAAIEAIAIGGSRTLDLGACVRIRYRYSEPEMNQASIEAIAQAAVHEPWTLERVLSIADRYSELEMNQALIEAIAQAAVHDPWTLERVLRIADRDSELGMNQASIRALEEANANARGSALDIQDEDQVRTNDTSRRLNDHRSLFDT